MTMRRASCNIRRTQPWNVRNKVVLLQCNSFDCVRDYLVQGFVVPVRIDLRECMSDTIVFSCHESVHACQHQLLIHSDFT